MLENVPMYNKFMVNKKEEDCNYKCFDHRHGLHWDLNVNKAAWQYVMKHINQHESELPKRHKLYMLMNYIAS